MIKSDEISKTSDNSNHLAFHFFQLLEEEKKNRDGDGK